MTTTAMMNTPVLYRFLFERRLRMKDVEDAVCVAYLAMRALHGEANHIRFR